MEILAPSDMAWLKAICMGLQEGWNRKFSTHIRHTSVFILIGGHDNGINNMVQGVNK